MPECAGGCPCGSLGIGGGSLGQGVPTRSDTNRAVQSQKMVRGWKFWI